MSLMADWYKDAFRKDGKPDPTPEADVWKLGAKLGSEACQLIRDGAKPAIDAGDSMGATVAMFLAAARVHSWIRNSVEVIRKENGNDSPVIKAWELCEAAFASGDDMECIKAMDEVAKSFGLTDEDMAEAHDELRKKGFVLP